jgi:hypothetical protein
MNLPAQKKTIPKKQAGARKVRDPSADLRNLFFFYPALPAVHDHGAKG